MALVKLFRTPLPLSLLPSIRLKSTVYFVGTREKSPVSSYIVFQQKYRAENTAALGDQKQLMKDVAKQWKSMPEESKQNIVRTGKPLPSPPLSPFAHFIHDKHIELAAKSVQSEKMKALAGLWKQLTPEEKQVLSQRLCVPAYYRKVYVAKSAQDKERSKKDAADFQNSLSEAEKEKFKEYLALKSKRAVTAAALFKTAMTEKKRSALNYAGLSIKTAPADFRDLSPEQAQYFENQAARLKAQREKALKSYTVTLDPDSAQH